MSGNLRKRLVWVLSAVALVGIGVPAMVCGWGHWRAKGQSGALGDQCCPASGTTTAATEYPGASAKTPFNEGREVLFKVDALACPLVGGVGCGHLLAPMIGKTDALEGVEEAFTNWSGQEIRVVACCAVERDATARRVEELLSSQKQKPLRIGEEAELEKRIKGQAWYGAQKVGDLTAHEFRTVARRRAQAFAVSEKLDDVTREKLLAIVERQWQKHSAIAGTLPTDQAAYAEFWNSRLTAFKKAIVIEAAGILSPRQLENLRMVTQERAK
ncbi:MAG TPA: hypothetical protein VGQ99_09230 [Tepidisphaeraceae bacterium]|jgi:hypothetical protein|nr:hypothetical protein [Tepidisphaeraceae bacterium]